MLNDYRCVKCDTVFEAWAKSKKIPSKCCKDYVAEKIISGGNFSLPGIDTGFPTAADKWARRHRKANHRNLKRLGIPH
jgi:hypothetical protein